MNPMHMHLRHLATACLIFLGGLARGQEHPFIAQYELTELSGAIRIDWTIQGGSTCNGQDVERSTDGIVFVNVHRIEGICGDAGVAIPYDWIDEAPPEFSTLYYRIKLGFDGYTSVKTMTFDQITTSAQRFFPSPVRDQATLALNVASADAVDLRILDESGRILVEQLGIAGPVIPLDLSGLPPGTYIYEATSNSRQFVGRFVKV
ncbi:MAG TPA: T9SS type A sorting domain-containing protein [Flavobacteriales bacterium]|nr:T9SS type A sorting domain-containing protein [Flavobacteriales bacterium]HMR28694.1 T9SS type A sorting domain-containing protein [Flavobacteriales bacterium]